MGIRVRDVFAVGVIAFALAGVASAQQWVNGYYKKDGTYVQGHYRSSPNQYRYDNYGSRSNGGTQRDEYSSGYGATNKSNPSYGFYDNDNDGILNQPARRKTGDGYGISY